MTTFDGFKVFISDRCSSNCRGGVVIYVKNDRPTSVSVTISKNAICECLQIIEQHADVDNVIVTGDFNENLNNAETHHLFNLLTAHGYLQLVKQSTFLTGSLLDVVYVKGELEFLRADVEPIYFSDHEIVSINIPP